MSIEHKCSECKLAQLIKDGEVFRHRYGMIAVHFGPDVLLRNCSTKEEKAEKLDIACDRESQFVAKEEKII